jgi:hypothetical protein
MTLDFAIGRRQSSVIESLRYCTKVSGQLSSLGDNYCHRYSPFQKCPGDVHCCCDRHHMVALCLMVVTSERRHRDESLDHLAS